MSLGSLVVHLAANIAAFDNDLGKAAHLSAKHMEKIKLDAEKAGKAIAAMFAVGVTTAAVLVKQAIDAADRMDDLAQQSGATTEALSALGYAAQIEGINIEQLAMNMAMLTKNASDTARGTGEAREAFRALGIEVRDAAGDLKNSDVLMAEIAEKFEGIEDGAGKTALAIAIFGRAGANMIPLLNQGASGLAKLSEEAHRFGAVITDDAAQAAGRFNDNLTRLNSVKKGLANTIMRELLPTMEALSDELVNAAVKSDMLDQAARSAAAGLRIVLTAGTVVGAVFKILGETIGAIAASIVSLSEGAFKRAWSIIIDNAQNAEATILGTLSTVNKIWDETSDSVVVSAERVAKSSAPVIRTAEEIAAAKKKEAEALREAEREYERLIDRLSRQAIAQANAQEQAEQAAIEQSELNRIAAEQIGLQFLTDEQRAEESFARQADKLRAALEDKVITQQYYNEVLALLEEQHQARLTELQNKGLTDREKFIRMSYAMQAKTVFGELESITAGVAQHNRALFEINKIAGIATAIISAHEGASRTLASYPWPLAGILAGIHYAAGAARVAAIAGTSFGGGGGSAPSLVGSTPATPVTPVPAPQPAEQPMPQTTIILQGESYTQKQVRELVEALFENSRDGGPRFA